MAQIVDKGESKAHAARAQEFAAKPPEVVVAVKTIGDSSSVVQGRFCSHSSRGQLAALFASRLKRRLDRRTCNTNKYGRRWRCQRQNIDCFLGLHTPNPKPPQKGDQLTKNAPILKYPALSDHGSTFWCSILFPPAKAARLSLRAPCVCVHTRGSVWSSAGKGVISLGLSPSSGDPPRIVFPATAVVSPAERD